MPVCEIIPPVLASPKACVSRSVLGPEDAAFGARATRDRLDADALHQLQIDEHAAVADRVARETVASATHGDWQARITCEGERRDDVGRACAAGNRGRTPIDYPVPHLAHRVVTRVGCRETGPPIVAARADVSASFMLATDIPHSGPTHSRRDIVGDSSS